MGCTKESHVSAIATLTPFLTSPSTIPASSDIVLTLSTLYPNDFLLSLPNCTCPQGSAFWNSHTVRLCSSFSTTEFILLFLQLSTLPKFYPKSPVARGHLYMEFQRLMQYVQYLVYHLLPEAETPFIFLLLLIYTYIF